MPIIIEVSTNASASVSDLARLKAAIEAAVRATNEQTDATKKQGDEADKAGRKGSSSKQQEKRDTDSLAAAFKAAQGAFGGFIGQLQREADMLQSIHGPMAETQNDLKALDALYRRGSLSITEYTAKSRDLQKQLEQQTRTAHGLPGASSGGGPSDGLSSAIQGAGAAAGPAGEILGAVTTGAVVQIGAIVGLAAAVFHLHDSYIELENQAMRIVGVNGDLTGTIQKQLTLAGQLHGSLATTMALTAKVREGTQDYYLTEKQMADVTKTVGEAVQLSGHSLEDAAGVMDRLSFAFEQGVVGPRELRGIFREYPAIAEGVSKALGKSIKDVLDMAKAGELSGNTLLNSIQKMGVGMDKTFSGRIETYAQKWQHFKDQMTVDAGQQGGLVMNPDDLVSKGLDMAKSDQLQKGAQSFASDFSKSGNIWSAAFGSSDGGSVQATKGTEDYVEKVLEATGAESRFYDQLKEVNKILRDQSGFYKGVTDAINAESAAMRDAGYKEDTYVAKIVDDLTKMNTRMAHATTGQIGTVRDQGTDQLVTDQRKLRDATDEVTASTESYGKTVVDAHKKTNEHHDGIQDLSKAFKVGQLTMKEYSDGMRALDEDFAFQYNVIKGIIQPARDYANTIEALLGGLKSGTIDLIDFNTAMEKLNGLTHQRSMSAADLAKMGVGAYSFGQDKTGKQQSGVLTFDTEDKGNPELIQQLKDMTEAYKTLNLERSLGAKFVEDQMRKQEAFNSVLGDSRTGAEKYAADLKIINDPEVLQTDEQHALALQNLKDKYTTILMPAEQFAKGVRKITEEQALGLGSVEAYDNAMRDLRIQFGTGTFTDGLSKGLETIKKETQDTASTISTTFVNAFHGVNDAIVDLAVNGTTDLRKLAESVERDIAKGLLQELEKGIGDLIGGGMSAAAGGAAAGVTTGTSAAATLMAEAPAIGIAIGSAAASMMGIGGAAGGIGAAGLSGADMDMAGADIAGFASGGSFVVGGSGPPDSKLFRFSPGEAVTVQTPNQRKQAQQSGGSTVHVINVSNAAEAARAEMDTPRAEKVYTNWAVKNRRTVGHITRR